MSTQSNFLRPDYSEAQKKFLVGLLFAVSISYKTTTNTGLANPVCCHMHFTQFVQQSQKQCVIPCTTITAGRTEVADSSRADNTAHELHAALLRNPLLYLMLRDAVQ